MVDRLLPLLNPTPAPDLVPDERRLIVTAEGIVLQVSTPSDGLTKETAPPARRLMLQPGQIVTVIRVTRMVPQRATVALEVGGAAPDDPSTSVRVTLAVDFLRRITYPVMVRRVQQQAAT